MTELGEEWPSPWTIILNDNISIHFHASFMLVFNTNVVLKHIKAFLKSK